MDIVSIIICTVVISFCMSALAGAVVWHTLSKKHREEFGMLKAQIANMQERWIWLEERYAKHEHKYHR
jgi:hypothetical protein